MQRRGKMEGSTSWLHSDLNFPIPRCWESEALRSASHRHDAEARQPIHDAVSGDAVPGAPHHQYMMQSIHHYTMQCLMTNTLKKQIGAGRVWRQGGVADDEFRGPGAARRDRTPTRSRVLSHGSPLGPHEQGVGLLSASGALRDAPPPGP